MRGEVAHAGERADPQIAVLKCLYPSHVGKMVDVQQSLGKSRTVLDQPEKIGAAGDEGELGILSMAGDCLGGIVGSGESDYMHDSAPPGGVRHGIDDVGIASAAAEISAHSLTDFRLRQIRNRERPGKVRRDGARPPRLHLLDHGDARHDLPGRTEAALQAVALDEGRLERVEVSLLLQALDGRDALAFLHRRQGHAGQHSAVIDMDGTGAALTAVATLLRPGQAEPVTKRFQKRVVPGSTAIPRACPLTVTFTWIFPIFQTTKGAVSPGVSDGAVLALTIIHAFHASDGIFALAMR